MSFEDASRVGMGAGGTALPLRRERRGGEVSGQGKTAEGVRETGQGRDQVSAVPRSPTHSFEISWIDVKNFLEWKLKSWRRGFE